jgi:hypothetical protein
MTRSFDRVPLPASSNSPERLERIRALAERVGLTKVQSEDTPEREQRYREIMAKRGICIPPLKQ